MSNITNCIILVGGNPKGFDYPFHEKTLSGKRIRKLIDKHHLITQFVDLWGNEEEEAIGTVDPKGIYWLQQMVNEGHKIIALGYKVFHTLENCNVPCRYLPHPASRRKVDLEKLEQGLQELHYIDKEVES